jgi:hypothetical protein
LEERHLKRIYQVHWKAAVHLLPLSKRLEIALTRFIILEAALVQQPQQHLAVIPPMRPKTQVEMKKKMMKEKAAPMAEHRKKRTNLKSS